MKLTYPGKLKHHFVAAATVELGNDLWEQDTAAFLLPLGSGSSPPAADFLKAGGEHALGFGGLKGEKSDDFREGGKGVALIPSSRT